MKKTREWEYETCGTCKHFLECEGSCKKAEEIILEQMLLGIREFEPGELYAGCSACHFWSHREGNRAR